MNLPLRFVVVACATVVLAGCSHGTLSEVPTAPTRRVPTVAIRKLTITPVGGGTMTIGGSLPITTSGPLLSTGATLGAFAEYTDGSGKYVEANWTSSDPAVIVATNTSLQAIGRGTATLTTTSGGQTATETFKVELGIPGTWAGTYRVNQCVTSSGSMQELICGVPGRSPGVLPVGARAPINFQIRQSGTELTATAAFGEIRGTLTGTDRGQNVFTLRGDLTANTTTLAMTHWDTRVTADAIEGFIAFEIRMAGVPGVAQLTGHFVDVTRR